MHSEREEGPIGFVGIGNMGFPIAMRLVEQGFDVVVHDLREEALARAAERGARTAASLAELARECRVVSVVLVDDDQVRVTVAGEGGLLDLLPRGSAVVVQATVLPSTVIDLGAPAAERGIDLIDAPVSGGSVRAEEGALAVMVGGEDAAVERCLPMLEPQGNVHRMGPLGSGQVMKLVNNIMFGGAKAFAFEGFKLAAAYGIEESVVREVASHGTGDSFFLHHVEHIDDLLVNHTLAGTDALWDIFSKDSWSALTAAHDRSLRLPLVGLLTQLYAGLHQERLELVRLRQAAATGSGAS